MANTAYTKAVLNGATAALTLTALSTSGVPFAFDAQDTKTAFVVVASAAGTMTVAAGDGIQAVDDLAIAVPSGTSVVEIESGPYKSGDHVTLKGADTITVAAVVLR